MLRILFALILIAAIGCAPRGETKSLDEILQIATRRYEKALAADVDPTTKERLAELASHLERVREGKKVSTASTFVADELHKLTDSSGYTSRPAMGELANQYRSIAKAGNSSEDQRILLVSRTYTLLAQELETMKFRVVRAG